MPRYFFDIDKGAKVADEVGRVLASPDLSKVEALRIVSAIVSSETASESTTSLVLSVRDQSGTILLEVRLVCQLEEVVQNARVRSPSRAL